MSMRLDKEFWEQRYVEHSTGWDIGDVSTPLKVYFDQLTDKDQRILIPGCGRAYEGQYLHELGFKEVHLLDLTGEPFKDLLERCPSFPKEHLITGDFFAMQDQYDLIIEQTFFCAIDPSLRASYAQQMLRLLKPGGRLVGLLFDDELNADHPPFGGDKAQYMTYFKDLFDVQVMEPCYNSIAPRSGRELFIILRKPLSAKTSEI